MSKNNFKKGGIRFVYFSPRETRRSRKVAEKMGLETDWNTSISLSAEKDLTENDGLMDQDIGKEKEKNAFVKLTENAQSRLCRLGTKSTHASRY